MRVEIVIDELVLTGIDPHDRHRIADALQRELAAIARADPRRWQQASAVDVLHAADCVLTPRGGSANATTLGAQLAGVIHRTLPDPPRPASAAVEQPYTRHSASAGPERLKTWRPASAGSGGREPGHTS